MRFKCLMIPRAMITSVQSENWSMVTLPTNACLELQTTCFLWLFQLDDSKSLHKKLIKMVVSKHQLKNGCLGYPVPIY